MIALLCSVQDESDLIMKTMSLTSAGTAGSKPVIEGTIAGREVILCIGGMGKANAAHASAILLSRPRIELLVIFGIGGAYPASGARIGDLAFASEEISGDEGVLTADGFKGAEFIGIPLARTETACFYNNLPTSAFAGDRIRRTLHSFPARVHEGVFVTVSTCSGTLARSRELEERYRGLCENMEGAAAAQTALHHGIPWAEVRGISNMTGDRDLQKWDIPGAASLAQKAVLTIIEEFRKA